VKRVAGQRKGIRPDKRWNGLSPEPGGEKNVGALHEIVMKINVLKSLSAVFFFELAVWAQAQTNLVCFDDLPTDIYQNGMVMNSVAVPVSSGYGSLNWNGFYAVDGNYFSTFLGQGAAGYFNAVISPNNEAITLRNFTNSTSGDISADAAYSLDSGYFTALYMDGLSLEVQGYNGANLLYDQTYLLGFGRPDYIQFNMTGITDAHFIASGGTLADVIDGPGENFAMDNLTISLSPEPSTVALLSLGGLSLLRLCRKAGAREIS
jgi:hypothetical protein